MKIRWLKDNDKLYDKKWFDINNEGNFVSCANSHPKGIPLCSTVDTNKREVKIIMSCSRFEFENDYVKGYGYTMTCAHCHGLGFKGVCEKHYKGR